MSGPTRAQERPDLGGLVATAWSARESLHAAADVDAYRLLHGWSEGLPGFEVDRYGEVMVIECRADGLDRIELLVSAFDRVHRFATVVVRTRGRKAYAELWRGEDPGRIAVTEGPLRMWVEPMRGGNPGLYLDARPVRRWIHQHACDRRVLNLFAFTGTLGLAARVGGAASVTDVDSHPAALAWCRDNARLCGIQTDERDVARMNIYQHLRRAQAGRQRYDAIILDPPPGPDEPRHKDRTPGRRGIMALAPRCAAMLNAGGWLLVLFHHRSRTHEQLEAELMNGAGVPLEVAWRGKSELDFPETDPMRKLRVTAFVRS